MAETTPFLDDIDDNNLGNIEYDAQTGVHRKSTPLSAYFKRPIKGLYIVTSVSAALSVALLIANYIIITCAPFMNRWTGQWTRGRCLGLGISAFISLIFAVINVLVNVPILISIVADIVLDVFIFLGFFRLLEALPDDGWCQSYSYPRPGYPGPSPPTPQCLHWKLVVTILIGISAGFAGIVGIAYLVILLLRSIALLRAKIWKRALSWTSTPGEITLQLSIKVSRQENQAPRSVSGVGRSVEAGPASVNQQLVSVD